MNTINPSTITVIYRPEQVAPRHVVQNSPSAAKPEAVVQSWHELGMPIQVLSFEPATRDQLAQVHDRDYVDGVLDLQRKNGFYNRSPEIAAALPYTSGSFVAAALHVLQHGGAAASPTSGFHHAHYSHAHGYCTFNGLALAAAELLQRGAQRVGILDCDAHYGDGTADILRRVGLFDGRVEHFTRGDAPYCGGRENVPAFLGRLPELLAEWKASGVEVVLYQAGADPHVNDPVGCKFLTTSELHERDRAVFGACARLGLPVAWNLAGGYQENSALSWPRSIRPVLDIHDNTMKACVEAFLGR